MLKLPVINLYGGPGSGKSTTAALVFGKLKQLGYNVELCQEYAKKCVWEKSFDVLSDQLYVLGKQNHKLHVLQDQVDCAITDSPLLISEIYNKKLIQLTPIMLECFNLYDNFNYVIERTKEYNPSGRMQNEEQAREIDQITIDVLRKYGIYYTTIPYGDLGVSCIVDDFNRYMCRDKSN